MPDLSRSVVEARSLGLIPYPEAVQLQQELTAQRRTGSIPDQLLLLEHPPVLTLGSSSQEEHVLLSSQELLDLGIGIHRVGRGGDVTYHGPGQLVGYPILALEPGRRDLHRYLRDLEQVLLDTVDALGVPAGREEGYTGVWTSSGKIAAIGVRVSSGWITSHGFALNVDPDLSHFSSIVPCGIRNRPVTSLAQILGREVSVSETIPVLLQAFEKVFSREIVVV